MDHKGYGLVKGSMGGIGGAEICGIGKGGGV